MNENYPYIPKSEKAEQRLNIVKMFLHGVERSISEMETEAEGKRNYKMTLAKIIEEKAVQLAISIRKFIKQK